jgi:hypothetical protein
MTAAERGAFTLPVHVERLHRPLMVVRVSTIGELQFSMPLGEIVDGRYIFLLKAPQAAALLNWLLRHADIQEDE